MSRLTVIVVLFLLISCRENREAVKKLELYFDLDSLLNEQVSVFSDEKYGVTKSVTMDEKTESDRLTPDSLGWVQEFAIIRDFNLNKSNNVGAYQVRTTAQETTYSLEEGNSRPVKQLVITRREGQLMRIEGGYFEDKSIYQHSRNLLLEFSNGVLSRYEIRGFQKMILKDTARYSVSGAITRP